MNNFFVLLMQLIIGIGWLMGIVLAKGFWWTILSIFCPCYSWYLVIEKMMILQGWT